MIWSCCRTCPIGEWTGLGDALRDDGGNGVKGEHGIGVSGDHVGVFARLGVCLEVGADDRVEVDLADNLTAGLDGAEERELVSVGRDLDLGDWVRCGPPRHPYRDWCLKRPCLFRTTLPQWHTTRLVPGKSWVVNRSSGCCLVICSNRSARSLLHRAQ